jgi:hypothetical protein
MLVANAIDDAPFDVDRVIHGNAEGVDRSADVYCTLNSIPVRGVSPDYEKFSDNPKYAPLARNKKMFKQADAVIAIIEGESRGTEHVMGLAKSDDMDLAKVAQLDNGIEVYYFI